MLFPDADDERDVLAVRKLSFDGENDEMQCKVMVRGNGRRNEGTCEGP